MLLKQCTLIFPFRGSTSQKWISHSKHESGVWQEQLFSVPSCACAAGIFKCSLKRLCRIMTSPFCSLPNGQDQPLSPVSLPGHWETLGSSGMLSQQQRSLCHQEERLRLPGWSHRSGFRVRMSECILKAWKVEIPTD